MKKNILKLVLLLFFILSMEIYASSRINAQVNKKTEAQIKKESMVTTIEEISLVPHPVNSKEIQSVKEYIVKYFEELGYDNIEYQKFEYNDDNNEQAIRRSSQAEIFLASTVDGAVVDGFGENIIITKLAETETKKNLIISAHYDSAEESFGANDNSSGVAVVLELARVLKKLDTTYNIKFIMFSGEEKWMLGSRWYVGNLSKEEQRNIVGVINIDSIAQKSSLGYMVMVNGMKRENDSKYDDGGIEKIAQLNRNKISDLFIKNDRFHLTLGMNSDHHPFSLLNIPAVSIVQDLTEGLKINDSSDTMKNIDPERLTEVAEQILKVLSEI